MSAEEIGIIILLALVVIGPQRLPEYAEQLGKMVRNVRKMATGATETIREELGDDLADLDLTKFDPRQYDPRRIVREALLEDIVPSTKPARSTAAPRTKPVSAGGPKEVAAKSTSARSTTASKAKTAVKTGSAAAAAKATSRADAAAPSTADSDTAVAVADDQSAEIPADVVQADDGQVADGELVAAAASPMPPFDDEAT